MVPSIVAALRSLPHHASILLPGAYAWLITVAVPASGSRVGASARLSAALALAALFVGPALLSWRSPVGRGVGIYGFIGLCLVSWLSMGAPIEVERLEPVRAALGAASFTIYAFGWGRLRDRRLVPEEHPRVIPGPVLEPRLTLPRGASWLLGASAALGLVSMALAWRVARPAHALFAHAVALLCAIGLLVAGSTLATERGRPRRHLGPVGRFRAARRSLALLVALSLIGLVFGMILGL